MQFACLDFESLSPGNEHGLQASEVRKWLRFKNLSTWQRDSQSVRIALLNGQPKLRVCVAVNLFFTRRNPYKLTIEQLQERLGSGNWQRQLVDPSRLCRIDPECFDGLNGFADQCRFIHTVSFARSLDLIRPLLWGCP